MGLFSRKKRDVAPADLPEEVPAVQDQAVITHLRLSNDDFGTTEEREAVFALEGRIAGPPSASAASTTATSSAAARSSCSPTAPTQTCSSA